MSPLNIKLTNAGVENRRTTPSAHRYGLGGDEGEEVTHSSQDRIQVSSSESVYKHSVGRWSFWQKGILFFFSGKINY